MKILFTAISVFLLLLTGTAFADNDIIKYLGKFNIRVIDRVSNDVKLVYHPVVNQVWKLQSNMNLDMNREANHLEWVHTTPVLYLGSIPEVVLKYQSNAVLQWGHTFRSSILLLRIGFKPEDVAHIDFRNKGENTYGFNFLIDFWFKW